MLFSLHQAINYTAEAATLATFPNFRFFMTNRAQVHKQSAVACDSQAFFQSSSGCIDRSGGLFLTDCL